MHAVYSGSLDIIKYLVEEHKATTIDGQHAIPNLQFQFYLLFWSPPPHSYTSFQIDVMYKTHYGNNCLHYLYEKIKESKNRLDEQAKWFEILRYICAHGGEKLKIMPNLHGQVRI